MTEKIAKDNKAWRPHRNHLVGLAGRCGCSTERYRKKKNGKNEGDFTKRKSVQASGFTCFPRGHEINATRKRFPLSRDKKQITKKLASERRVQARAPDAVETGRTRNLREGS